MTERYGTLIYERKRIKKVVVEKALARSNLNRGIVFTVVCNSWHISLFHARIRVSFFLGR
ncbi:MAG: hypothetical protein AYP45_15525 [Candidatus Brocadia carolinensis]|uniref:Uncharacterized protein n=1 Tax=Candidatus Brocadia carolinensis TaxID=1004156 RepID=A0A1V4AQB6_9BACT|nr:MAG: hypothetical protein AYP45_15525 [Candidatus Brocadia caroliniensis]